MRIIYKLPKINKEKHLSLIDNLWVQLKEPRSTTTAILISIPLMILCTLIALGIINIFYDISLKDYGISLNPINIRIEFNLFYIAGIVLLLMIHELLHLVFIPNFVKSNRTYIGISLFGGYVYTEEILTKKRYIIITISPFIFISVILPVILGISGLLNPIVVLIILLNSIGSGVDILSLILVLIQVPSGANLVSNGTNNYWKKL